MVLFDQDRGEAYTKQLMMSSLPLPQIKVKFFGSTGVGKSTLIETLKCGLFSSFFRRSRLSSSSANPSSGSGSKSKGFNHKIKFSSGICLFKNYYLKLEWNWWVFVLLFYLFYFFLYIISYVKISRTFVKLNNCVDVFVSLFVFLFGYCTGNLTDGSWNKDVTKDKTVLLICKWG